MFIEKLEYLMEKNNISSLKELHKVSKIPYTTLRGFYDKGTDGIRNSTLQKLSKFFGCTIDYLVNDDIPKTHILHLAGITEKDYIKIRNDIVHNANNDIIDISSLTNEEKSNIIYIVELMKRNNKNKQ